MIDPQNVSDLVRRAQANFSSSPVAAHFRAPIQPIDAGRRPDGRTIMAFYFKATSGALPSRMVWYRRNLPMTDRAIESGLYMRTLTRREAVAHMASTVVDFLMSEGRFQEAIEVGELILQHYPRDGYTPVKVGTAYAELMRIEFL